MASTAHIVAVPFPGRGNINPMMSFCKLLASNGVRITFVVTEEWHTLLEPPHHLNLHLQSIPNVVSHKNFGSDFAAYLEAVLTKMEAPLEQLLNELECEVTGILADGHLPCAVAVGNRKNIRVFSMWMQSASVFTVFHHFDMLVSNHGLAADLSGREKECVDYIPGIKSTRLVDLHSHCFNKPLLHWILHAFSWISKAQCLILTSFYELEHHVIDTLKEKLSIPIYPVGPCIPYMTTQEEKIKHISTIRNENYFTWLDSQPRSSVLYISLGSYLRVSGQQLNEIECGIRATKTKYLFVVRENHCQAEIRSGGMGMVVPWCDQLSVLCHPSVGGFLTHCGWNSVMEGVYVGLSMLVFPLSLDQFPNSKLVVDDWKVGLRLKDQGNEGSIIKREEIAKMVKTIMDEKGDVSKELRMRAKELQLTCHGALKEGGSSFFNLGMFVKSLKGCDS